MFPFTSRGMSAPMVSHLVWRGAMMTKIWTRNNEWSKLCSACFVYIVPFAVLCSKMCPPLTHTILKRRFFHLLCTSSHLPRSAQKCDHLHPTPPNPYISESAFSHKFQKVYAYPPPPQGYDNLAHRTESLENLGTLPKPTKLAYYELPLRDIHSPPWQKCGFGREPIEEAPNYAALFCS